MEKSESIAQIKSSLNHLKDLIQPLAKDDETLFETVSVDGVTATVNNTEQFQCDVIIDNLDGERIMVSVGYGNGFFISISEEGRIIAPTNLEGGRDLSITPDTLRKPIETLHDDEPSILAEDTEFKLALMERLEVIIPKILEAAEKASDKRLTKVKMHRTDAAQQLGTIINANETINRSQLTPVIDAAFAERNTSEGKVETIKDGIKASILSSLGVETSGE